MITIKSEYELSLMRIAGRIVYDTHQYIKDYIKPGITTGELDKLAHDYIISRDATPSCLGYEGYPASICISVNEEVVHGIPGKRKLKNGDIVSVDVGACYQGYHGDSAWTYAVGEVSDEAKRLMKVTEEALYEGLKQAKPGNHVGDISAAIENYVRKNGYTSPEDYTGHGVGTSIHEDPMVPNYGKYGHGPLLKPGMVIAVEPMVHAGKKEVKVLKDGWGVVTADHSLAAHYEHTIVITEDGYEILTKL